MKGIGGLTSSVGGLIRGGSNLVQGFAGLTGNQDLARQALQFDRNLGTDEAIANINRNNSQANTFAGQVAESIGGMIPTIGANLVGGFAGVGEQAGLGMFVDLMAGDVDYAAVMQAARNIGYDKWATVEFLPNYKNFPYQSITNACQSMKTILTL